ncbi:MAG TPA: serine/threonine protein kinase [Planctomycetes bacterium]|nr:serine/threonine protein kinase [Planctomycetota bacterium]
MATDRDDGHAGAESPDLGPLERFFLDGGSAANPEELLEYLDGADNDERLRELLELDRVLEVGLAALDEARAAERRPLLGRRERLGGYRLLQEIGSGGMGVLYLAEDETLGRLIALKVVSKATPRTSERFRREAETVAALNHPNIVPVYALGEADGVEYIAMKYLPGGDVERALGRAGHGRPLTGADRERKVARWMLKVAEALHHAHEHGVIHRDLKPSNILVEDDEPFLVDFGLALREDRSRLTQPGELVGTVAYMSPEQVRGDLGKQDRRTDVYSFGATLYHLLSGRLPFAGGSAQAVGRAVLQEDPPALRPLGISADLEAIVFQCLEKQPDRRYATARDLAGDLRRFLDGEPVSARRQGPLRRGLKRLRRHWLVVSGAALALAAAFVIAALLWQSSERERRLVEETYASARSEFARGNYGRAGRLLQRLVDRGIERDDVRELLASSRIREIFDRLMELRYFVPLEAAEMGVASSRADTSRRLLEERRALGHPEILRDQFRFLEIATARFSYDRKGALSALRDWTAELGGPRPRTRLMDVFVQSPPEAELDARSMIQALDGATVLEDIDHYFGGLLLALTPGGARRGLQEIRLYLESHPTDYWGRFVEGNLLRRLGNPAAAREVYSGLIAGLLTGRDGAEPVSRKLGAAYFQRAQVKGLEGDADSALADLEKSGNVAGPRRLAMSRAQCFLRKKDAEAVFAAFESALSAVRGERRMLPKAVYLRRLNAVRRQRIQAALALGRRAAARRFLDEVVGRGDRPPPSWVADLEARYWSEALRTATDSAKAALAALGDLADKNPDSDLVRLLHLEGLFLEGTDLEREKILNTLDDIAAPSLEERYFRAYFRVVLIIEGVRRLADYRPREGQEEAFRRAMDQAMDDVAALAHRAADDLGVLEAKGFDVLVRRGLLDDADVLRFLLATARLFAGDVETAGTLFEGLLARGRLRNVPWRPLVFVFAGRSEEERGFPKRALDIYRAGLAAGLAEPWLMRRAGRLAAELRDLEALVSVVAFMRGHEPKEGWTDRELTLPVYAPYRTRLTPHR